MSVICVLGMHRSGTSVVIRALNLLGVFLGKPEHLLKPAPDNPEGYWENKPINDLNDELLNRLGGTWHKPPRFLEGWAASADLTDLRSKAEKLIHEQFAASSVWGWKDPRTCLTLPFWQMIIPDIRYVICVRNPINVCRSHQRREGFAPEKSARLWTMHTLSSFLHTKGAPRMITFYENYFDRWNEELQRLSEFVTPQSGPVSSDIRNQFKSYFKEQLGHHRETFLETLTESHIDFATKSLYSFLRFVFDQKYFEWEEQELEIVDRFCLALDEQEMKPVYQLQATVDAQRHAIAKNNEQILQLETTVDSHKQQLTERDQMLQERDHRIRQQELTLQNRDRMLQERDSALQTIHASLGWKLVTAGWKIKDALIPQETLRRKFYNAILRRFKPEKA